jgi:hypothetical protein
VAIENAKVTCKAGDRSVRFSGGYVAPGLGPYKVVWRIRFGFAKGMNRRSFDCAFADPQNQRVVKPREHSAQDDTSTIRALSS